MTKNQIKIFIIDGSGSSARQERKHQGLSNIIEPEESRLRDRSLHETGFCSRKGKTGDVSGSERASIMNHLYEQMVLERLGNKNGQIFFNQ